MQTTLVPVHLNVPTGGGPRSEGVHVSSVIRAIALENGVLEAKFIESLDLVDLNRHGWWDSLEPHVQIRIAIGCAWDEWYLPNLGTVTPHPGEMCVQGVYMTNDGESVEFVVSERMGRLGLLACHEVKATYKSLKTVGDLSTQWMWLTQARSYCKGLGTRVCYLHVLFLCGDYKFPITPQILCWRVEFTQAEIDDTWDLILGYIQHRKHLEAGA